MASGSTVFSVGKNMNLYVVTSESNIDVTNNKSRVNVTVYLRNSTTYYDLDKISKLTVTIGGTQVYYSGTHSYDFRNTNQITVKSGIYRDITHAADGSGSAVVRATFQTDIHGSATVDVTQPLTTIARASTPTLSSTTPAMGSTITVNMNSKSSNFRHHVYHDFHDGKWTLLESNVISSCSFALPLATFAARIPNATSGNGRVQVDTYNNGSFIGSKTVSFTASVPASVVPTVSSISASDLNTTVNTAIGATTYVQSQSKPRFTANSAAGIYGSTIKSYEFKFDGLTYTNNGNIKDFPAIKGSGSMTGTVTVTDSRGRKSAAKSVSLTVLPYSIPAITTFTVTRTGADDATLQARRAGKMSSLIVGGVEKNKIDLKIDTTSRGGSTWTNRYTVTGSTSVTFDSSVNLTGSFPNSSSFDVRFTLSDVFNSVNRVVSVSTASIAMSMFGDTGIAIGKIYDTAQGGALQVNGPVRGGLTIDGAAGAAPLKVRGIEGFNGGAQVGAGDTALYLNWTNKSDIVFGGGIVATNALSTINRLDITESLALGNNVPIYGKNTSGINKRLLVKGTDNKVHINPDVEGDIVLHTSTVPATNNRYLGVRDSRWLQGNFNANGVSHSTTSPGSGASINFWGSNSVFEMGVGPGTNERTGWINVRHAEGSYSTVFGTLKLQAGGSTTVGGSFSVSGSKNAIHPTRDGFRLTPAYETAESYLGDIGESKTDYTNEIKVYIETLFHDTINTEVPYQVFLQSYGDGFVWVSERNYDHFIVKSSAPNIAFAWELKAKRRGYEEDRLVLSETTYEDAQKMEGLHGGYITQSKEEGVITKEEGAKI